MTKKWSNADLNKQKHGNSREEYEKPVGHNIKGKGSKDQLDFNTKIPFIIQESQQQILKYNNENLSANLTSTASKLKKRNRLIKLADPS